MKTLEELKEANEVVLRTARVVKFTVESAPYLAKVMKGEWTKVEFIIWMMNNAPDNVDQEWTAEWILQQDISTKGSDNLWENWFDPDNVLVEIGQSDGKAQEVFEEAFLDNLYGEFGQKLLKAKKDYENY